MSWLHTQTHTTHVIFWPILFCEKSKWTKLIAATAYTFMHPKSAFYILNVGGKYLIIKCLKKSFGFLVARCCVIAYPKNIS